MPQHKFIVCNYHHSLTSGTVSWQAPSNIALVKYWGKYGEQMPMNPSLSFTLENCHTKTSLHYERKQEKGFDFEVYLHGKREIGFEPKINTFFERIAVYMPFLEDFRFRIETCNSFPHSSGIASSASGMAALALCLMDMERQMLKQMDIDLDETWQTYFAEKASFLARLGSGSACRSLEGPLIVWGQHADIENSSNLFGSKYPDTVHPNFKNYQDTILLVDKGEKQISSTVGHNLMIDNPYAAERFRQAKDNLSRLIPVFKNGDLSEFVKIVESEALSLHAMMLTSSPYFILMKPHTLEIINRIWKYREDTGSHACFTLDAGANVHLLYPEGEKEAVQQFIKSDLVPYCKNGEYIEDHVGLGARALPA